MGAARIRSNATRPGGLGDSISTAGRRGTNRNGTAIMAPVVRIKELKDLVFHYLNQHQEASSLTWHGALPEDESWVKVGGDNGGKLFKFSFQIANVLNPNSVHNTVPFLVFGANDIAENLTTASKPYSEQLLSL